MKPLYIYIAAAALIFMPALVQASVVVQSPTNTLTSGLVGYWTMDGKHTNWSTGQMTDMSGQGNYGQLVALATTTSPVAGKIAQALIFNGFNTKIVMASTTLGDFGTSNFSVSGWFKTSTTTQGTLVAKRPLCGHTSFWSVAINSTVGKLFFEVDEDASGTNYKAFSSNKTVTDGVWHHFVFTRSGTTISAYIDGVFDNSGTATGVANISNGSAQTIGYSTGCGRDFNGAIDDVRVYNRALSATEAAQLYKNGGGVIGKSSATLTTGLVGYWPLDGKNTNWATGSTTDLSGQGNNGQLVSMSTTTSVVAGKIGQALLFDGVNDKVLVADASSLNPTTVTISAWIYSTGADPSTNSERIVDKANSGTINQNGYRMQAFSAANCGSTNPEWGMQWYNGSAQLLCGPVIASTTRKWTHIVFTHDGTTGRIYANGVLVGSRVASYTGTNTFNLAIGNSDQVTKTFNGDIDDVRMYNRALSATEVAQLYKNGGGTIGQSIPVAPSGLVGQWTFDGKTMDWIGGLAKDSSGQGNSGQLISMSTTTSPVGGKSGQALKFSGTSYVDAGNGSALRISGDITISTWVNASTIPSGAGQGPALVGKFNTTGNARSYQLYILESSNTPAFIFSSDGTSATNANVLANTAITTNKWYHIVVTHSSAGVVRIYINGVLDKVLSGVSGSIYDSGTAANLNIGRQGDGNRPFTGSLDDVRVYNRVLSATEVAHIYAAGK